MDVIDEDGTEPNLPDVDESLPDRKPRPVETKPKTSARAKLKQVLVAELEFDQDSASAIVALLWTIQIRRLPSVKALRRSASTGGSCES